MSIIVSKPEFNLRDKLNELNGKVPYEKMPAGSVLQVKYSFIAAGSGSTHNSNSTTYNDTGEHVLISPRFSTSQILVSLGVQIYATNSSYHSYVAIVRDNNIGSGSHSNNNALFHSSALWESSGPGQATNISQQFLDSPGTTDEVKYSIYVKSDNTNNTVYINGSTYSDAYIMAMEIKQ
tara:strand:- start:823 stop:1359 length:537 start_codon:yes stop_codon:yes gene_type:complete